MMRNFYYLEAFCAFSKRLSIDEMLDSRWFLPSEFVSKKRSKAQFTSTKIKVNIATLTIMQYIWSKLFDFIDIFSGIC